MIIAIDVDEVLADLLSQFIIFHNETYGTKLKREEFITYNWWDTMHEDFEQMKKEIYNFFKSSYIKDVKPVEGAQEGVKRLKRKHDLIIITSRPYVLSVLTEHWINNHFPNCFSKFYFTKSIIDNDTLTKAEACRMGNASILIDDQIKYVEDCAKNGIDAILFDQPWNMHYMESEKVKKAYSWPEIVDEIEITI
jgi:5'-nucleotidase